MWLLWSAPVKQFFLPAHRGGGSLSALQKNRDDRLDCEHKERLRVAETRLFDGPSHGGGRIRTYASRGTPVLSKKPVQ